MFYCNIIIIIIISPLIVAILCVGEPEDYVVASKNVNIIFGTLR